MSKLYVDRIIHTIDGKVFEPKSTLREALFSAVTAHIPSNPQFNIKGDETLSMEEKLKLHRLAQLVNNPGKDDPRVLELDIAQLNTIRDRCSKIYSIHFFGQIADMLEDGATPPVIAEEPKPVEQPEVAAAVAAALPEEAIPQV